MRDEIKRPMTAQQATALAGIIREGGKLVRHPGGYWTYPGAVMTGVIGHPFDWWAGAPTVDGLVRRGRLEYTAWRDGKSGRFPIEVTLTSAVRGDAT